MKTKILNFLKRGEKSTTEIASVINRNYYSVLRLLEELEGENKILRISVRKFTFWRIKK
ncbi:MAG TPA: FaeA/PapI family transcriptional regulator [Candidatus Lokiarchaeia archaeon]